jgi:hypothetical protein
MDNLTTDAEIYPKVLYTSIDFESVEIFELKNRLSDIIAANISANMPILAITFLGRNRGSYSIS